MSLLQGGITALTEQINTFGQSGFSVLAPYTRQLFSVFLRIWLLIVLYQAYLKGRLEAQIIITNLVIFSIIMWLLSTYRHFYDQFFYPLNETVDNICQLIVRTSRIGEGGANQLIDTLENKVFGILKFGQSAFKGSWFAHFNGYISLCFLMIPYMTMAMLFIFFYLQFKLEMAVLYALAPLLIAAFGFRVTRGVALGGIRLAMHGSFTLIVSVCFIVLSLVGIETALDPANAQAERIALQEARSLNEIMTEKAYWGLLIFGWVSCLLQFKAPGIASTLTSGAGGSAFESMGRQVMSKMAGASHVMMGSRLITQAKRLN